MKKIVIALLLMGGIFMGCSNDAKALTPEQQAEIRAIALVAKLEGFRADWYNCSAGVRTIGYGFTKSVLTADEQKLSKMDRATADKILGREVRKIQRDIRKVVTKKMTVNQEVAVISFVYNLGLPNFKKSTLLKRINDGSSDDVIVREFGRWVYGGLYKKDKNGNYVLGKDGKKIPVPLKGLVSRRQKESAFWLA